MIYTVVCDVSRVGGEDTLQQLSPPLFSLLGDRGDAVAKKEREKAYICLALIYEYLTGGSALSAVERDEFGKLSFKKKGTENVDFPSFSLSHSGELVAVVFSDKDEKIGVDIQLHAPVKNEEKIKERLLHSCPVGDIEESEIKVSFCKIDEALKLSLCEEKSPFTLSLSYDSDFFSLWTATEAALKADGGGFASICRLRDICPVALVKTYKIDYMGRAYSLSAVKIKSS